MISSRLDVEHMDFLCTLELNW